MRPASTLPGEAGGPVGAGRGAAGDGVPAGEDSTRPVVLVSAIGRAEGGRAAAAALACAGVGAARSPLLLDVGGCRPRPTLLASAAAKRIEDRLAAALPGAAVGARGGVCHAAVRTDPAGIASLGAALDLLPRTAIVVHCEQEGLRSLMGAPVASRIAAALILSEPGIGRALAAPLLFELLDRGLAVALMARRQDWVAERRAMFGALPAGEVEGLPPALVAWFAGSKWSTRRPTEVGR
ncbi:MAG TPA: hypothetical protein VHA80_05535 [Solirubrobacterales bacterium]|nr:hypothetical protein [Solirubrobacterales bacterium]